MEARRAVLCALATLDSRATWPFDANVAALRAAALTFDAVAAALLAGPMAFEAYTAVLKAYVA